MLQIKRFVCNVIQENCYVVSDETQEAVIIDCGAQFEAERQAIKNYIESNHLRPVHLLATHGHVDHNIGNKFVFDTWGLKVELHKDDEPLISTLSEQAKQFMRQELAKDEQPPVGRYLEENDTITFGTHTLQVIETPGHSQGSVFFWCKDEKVAFSGDTLFRNSVGRADLPGGSMFLLIQSLRMVCQLDDDTRILPGHGEETTVGRELASNPYLDR